MIISNRAPPPAAPAITALDLADRSPRKYQAKVAIKTICTFSECKQKKKVNKTESQLQSWNKERSRQTLWNFKRLYSGKSSTIVVYRNYLTSKSNQ